MQRFIQSIILSSLLVLIAPIAAANDALVTRGDFIRDAIKAMDIDVSEVDESGLSEYVRVPRGLRPYIAYAHNRGALRLFGKDLTLGRGITRGQAVQVVVKLGNFEPASPPSNFRDVRKGTAAEGAVGIALDQGWLQPLRDDIFGTNRMLGFQDAVDFLVVLGGSDSIRPSDIPNQDQPEGRSVPTIRVNVDPPPSTRDQAAFPKADILNTLWNLIQSTYLYDEKIDPDDIAYDAAEAIMKSLDDPYSVFMRPVNSRNFQTQIQGEVTGIGAQVEYKDEILTIVTPLRGSPAEKAGLLPGDKIVKVDGDDIVGIGFGDAVERVRGPKGSTVVLTINRDGIVFDKTVTRDVIKVPEIEITWQEEFAVVKLLQFGAVTDSQLRPEMEKVQKQNPKGIVLDLRNNPGGLLHAANVVMSNFVKKGTVVAKVVAREDERTESTDDSPTVDMSVPLVVLINGGSASASEIVAGALQDHGRATVIGEKSFGKGTVQQVVQFTDQSGMKMTVAEWLTPKGRKIDGVGVLPDIIVPTDDRDTQLSEAIDLLRKTPR